MGAIYGLIGEADGGWLSVMGKRLRHRGAISREWTDDRRIWLGGRFHKTQTAPVVIDGTALVADATIYNAAELRARLEAQGHRFETDRDEELILRGYQALGWRICEQLNGDFAFALWDGASRSLLLARDPLGARPLYYWKGGGLFAFASEYKTLLAIPVVPAEPDLNAVQYLQYAKYPPPNRTLIRGIVSVPPGHVLEIMGRGCQAHRYWDVAIELRKASMAEHTQAVRGQFLDAVKKRLGHLTEVGAMLSGGIDSTAVVAAIRHLRPEIALHTFTCGYGLEDPEIQGADIVARAMDTTHHHVIVTPEDLPPLLPQVVWHLEDPVARSETPLIFETARHAPQYVEVVLTGYASDGLFGGMPKHKVIKLMQWFPWLNTPLWEFYTYTQLSRLPTTVVGKLLHRAYYRGSDSPPPAVAEAAGQPAAEPPPASRTELLNHVLRSGILKGPRDLHKADRLHWAQGVSFRTPFTDLNLVRTAFQISDRYKIHRWQEKAIFRKAMQPLLPPSVLNRPKFPQAMRCDTSFSNILEHLSHAVLSPTAVQARGWFCLADIERLQRRRANSSYPVEQAMRLWTAVLTELWAQIFLDRRGEPPQKAQETSHGVPEHAVAGTSQRPFRDAEDVRDK